MLLDIVKKGTTDYSVVVRFVDSTDGTPETGVVAATTGLTMSYRRGAADGGTQSNAVTLESGTAFSNLASAATAHTDSGIIHLGNGYYRVDLPDAAIASGAQYCEIFGGATDMIMMGGRLLLTAVSLQTLANMGMTSLPAVAPNAAGGLLITAAGSLDADAMAASVTAIEVDTGTTLDGKIDTIDSNVDAILLDTGTDGVVVATGSKTGYALSAAGVDAIWDENLSGHVAANSAGASLYVIRSNTAQAGTTTSITLDASASATDDAYNNQRIYVVSGTGAGQGSYITDYTGSTKVADIQDTWVTAPSSDSVFVIVPAGGIPGASAPSAATVADAVWDEVASGHASEGTFGSLFQPAQVGTAQAGGASSITLDATGASATTDFYKYGFVKIIGGTGAGQSRQISAYNGSTKAATVSLPWTVTPDATSAYVLTNDFGIDAATVDAVADAVWDEQRSGHVQSGSFGERVLSNATQISGSSAAADALEAATTGATPLPSNVTQVSGVAEDLPTATALATVDTNVDSILVDTGTDIPAAIAALNDLSAADIFTAQMTESYNTDGAAPTLAQALFVMMQRLTESEVSGTTLTVKKLDGSTAAYTMTLDSGTTPTTSTRAT